MVEVRWGKDGQTVGQLRLITYQPVLKNKQDSQGEPLSLAHGKNTVAGKNVAARPTTSGDFVFWFFYQFVPLTGVSGISDEVISPNPPAETSTSSLSAAALYYTEGLWF